MRTPYFNIAIQGVDITPWVSMIRLTESDSEADSVSFTIPDPRLAYADAIVEGCLADIDIGYAGNQEHALVMRALITKVDVRYPERGIPELVITGEDRSILMGLTSSRKVYRGTVNEIVRQVAGPFFGTSNVMAKLDPDPKAENKAQVQDGITALAFLNRLAKRYHAKGFVELDGKGNEVYYFLPERHIATMQRPGNIHLRYRMGQDSNLISFEPTFDSHFIDFLRLVEDVDAQGKKIQSRRQPPDDIPIWQLDRALVGQASRPDQQLIQQLYDTGIGQRKRLYEKLKQHWPTVGMVAFDQEELDSMNELQQTRRLGMRASGTTFGNIWLRAKSTVVIEGTHRRFAGVWYVTNVTHTIDSNRFKTDFRCSR